MFAYHQVMSYTKLYTKLPDSGDARKRKRVGRGRVYRGGGHKRRNKPIVIDDSSSESPMKHVTFDLTVFSGDEDEEVFQVRAPTPTEEDEEQTAQSDDDAEVIFNSDDSGEGDSGEE